ncbi:argininosuccinate synthase [Phaeocystidibacter marisrubri]|uniref:argininosuccinate synthase n=1 Tax=Phaeocystidibacter marisrubri TaxID=1577780 RepID=A0A6L3ZLR4_9FLAO|nr:argininosuccinate synthase domain-containing protein [Phaeocystidibacter marisrubri]KAB2818100.1 argininosuccinate synthase [Phaeocystidibacter marisrubri]GGH71952.1 argininosuccinate synthase [Phaeocystidibacter marisrubri]
MTKNKVLLAFSGGLDTTFCVKYLMHELNMEVHSAIVNTGGFSPLELKSIEQKAHDLGVTSHVALEQTEDFYEDIIRYLIYGNILKNGTYPLSVSAERVHQATALAKYALEIGVDAIAHGSTGAGNDQVRFDLAFQLIAPQLKIITPIRDLKISRQDEIDYLKKFNVDLPWEKAKYSINKGIWGTSVGGVETLTSNQALPESAYPSQLKSETPSQLSITFTKGEVSGVNGEDLSPVEAILKIEEIASAYAIGRDIHVGDTIIGIKGRVGFEAAASITLIKAHQALEKHTLSKWQMHWKEQLSNWYGMFLHESMFFEPVMRNIETFLKDTQKNVTGTVFLQLHPYRFVIEGIESKYDLMNSEWGQYGEMNAGWSGEDVKGFTKILANPMLLHQKVNTSDD